MSSAPPPSGKTPTAAPTSGKKPAGRGLGRGLSSLLGDSGIAQAATASAALPVGATVSGLQQIPVEWINVGPWQPRRRFDKTALAELASSIREKGIVQPILVRPDPKKASRYQLVAGERRWRAAQLAKLHQVPAIIRNLDEADCYEIALIENIQRTDLTVIEEAQGYKSLLDTNQYTQDQLSEIIGKSRSHIANLMRLLSLPDAVQTLILDRQLSMGQARPLIGHVDAVKLAQLIVAKGLSARQVETLVKSPANDRKSAKKQEKSADIKALEKRAATELGLSMAIDWDEAIERGKVTIDCRSLDQMTAFLKKLGLD